jgi:hypothetical protein
MLHHFNKGQRTEIEEEDIRSKTKSPRPGDPRKFPCMSWALCTWSQPSVAPYLVLPRPREPLSELTAPAGNTPELRGSAAGGHLERALSAGPQAAGDAVRDLVGDAPTLCPRAHVCRQLGTGALPCEGTADPIPCVFRTAEEKGSPRQQRAWSSPTSEVPACSSRRALRHDSATARPGAVGVASV